MDSDLLPLERFPQKYNLSHVTIWKYRRAGLSNSHNWTENLHP